MFEVHNRVIRTIVALTVSQCMECVRGDFPLIHWIKHAAIILMSIVGGVRLMEFKIFRIKMIVQCTIAVTMEFVQP